MQVKVGELPQHGCVNLCHFCTVILPAHYGYDVNGKFVYVCDRRACELQFIEGVEKGTLFTGRVPGPVRDNGGYHLNVVRRAVR